MKSLLDFLQCRRGSTVPTVALAASVLVLACVGGVQLLQNSLKNNGPQSVEVADGSEAGRSGRSAARRPGAGVDYSGTASIRGGDAGPIRAIGNITIDPCTGQMK